MSAAAVAEAGLRFSGVAMDGQDIYWLEGRPHEGGRYVLVRRTGDGSTRDVTPADFNVRTRVHEYGGGAFLVADGVAYCANFSDQRIYRIDVPTSDRRGTPIPRPLTPPGAKRYADFCLDRGRERLICVCEDHSAPGEPRNALVAISLDGAMNDAQVLASGADFYSTPRLSPDGSTLAWLSWNHPQMPWDGTELWTATIDQAGFLKTPRRLAGGTNESIYQPGWLLDGALCFASDRAGWWRIYRSERSNRVVELVANPPQDAEFGRPQWIFGTSVWSQAGPSTIVVSYTREGRWHLASVDYETGLVTDLSTDLQPSEWLVAGGMQTVLVAGSTTTSDEVVRIDVRTAQTSTLKQASSTPLAPEWISKPEPIEFPTRDGHTAHAFFYPPLNPGFVAPRDERPPLIVISHGGPTSAAHSTLSLQIQFWTTRGFAVVDVNYGGSTGYGRPYRERLNGQWGIVDVDDVVGAAMYLASQGKADEKRMVVRGGSAGGYTALAALAFRPEVFQAAASYYGISDLEALELDTHKFESRYSHSLIGPYPEARQTYRDRSPIHALDRLACPLILFQGLDDKVVPPNQSEMMADAVRAKGLPVAYLAFEGEQHGFRRADTIVRCLEAELFFYGAVFGFTPADTIPPVTIDNL